MEYGVESPGSPGDGARTHLTAPEVGAANEPSRRAVAAQPPRSEPRDLVKMETLSQLAEAALFDSPGQRSSGQTASPFSLPESLSPPTARTDLVAAVAASALQYRTARRRSSPLAALHQQRAQPNSSGDPTPRWDAPQQDVRNRPAAAAE
jgi:hypothetical protein